MSYTQEFRNVLLSDPHAILGKKGITDEFIDHTNKLLKRNKVIKIKALKSVANRLNIKEIANKVADATESYLLDVRGLRFIISKSPLKKKR